MFGLRKTLSSLFNRSSIDESLFESLEESLLMADVGMNATQRLMNELRSKVKKEKITDIHDLKAALAQLVSQLLLPLEPVTNPLLTHELIHQPEVWLVVGVNGAGKTTSIGKMCRSLQLQQRRVILAAGDTFRAAAREQLQSWGDKNDVAVINQASGDAATVAHDAVGAAIARNMDVLVIDTAGRLATQSHLMEELKKVQRVIGKVLPGAPHEVILVLDGNTGQNGVAQVKAFHEALGLTGLVITKMDGTAKGGVLCAIAELFGQQTNAPKILALGIGEGIDQLAPFKSDKFAQELVDSE